MKKEHGESFLQGTLYLSTFDNIRRHETGQYVADKDEGKGSYYTDKTIISHSDNPDEQEIIKRLLLLGISVGPSSMNITIINCTSDVVNKNAYMFCLTTERNDKDWLEKEGYDSCFSIEIPPAELAQNISDNLAVTLKSSIRFWYNACSYISDKQLNIKDEKVYCDQTMEYVARYFRKPYNYSHQKEYRFVFFPENEMLPSDALIDSPEIKPYIKRLF
jgi:hypothetical protein